MSGVIVRRCRSHGWMETLKDECPWLVQVELYGVEPCGESLGPPMSAHLYPWSPLPTGPAGPVETKARPMDAPTAKRAAELNAPRRGSQRGRILLELAVPGRRLATADELAGWTGIPLGSVSTRMSELVRGELVTEHGTKRGPHGAPKTLYMLTGAGAAWVREH